MITFDAASKVANGGSTGPVTWSHTCSGSDRLLLVGIKTYGSADPVTGVTYNGVAMTQLKKVDGGTNDVFNYVYGLLSPDTGAHDISISYTGGQYVSATAGSYTGVLQSGLPDATAEAHYDSTGTTSLNTTITTVLNNCYVGVFGYANGGNHSLTNATIRIATTVGDAIWGDSNSAISPAGNLNVIDSFNNSVYAGLILVSFAPAPVVSGYFAHISV